MQLSLTNVYEDLIKQVDILIQVHREKNIVVAQTSHGTNHSLILSSLAFLFVRDAHAIDDNFGMVRFVVA